MIVKEEPDIAEASTPQSDPEVLSPEATLATPIPQVTSIGLAQQGNHSDPAPLYPTQASAPMNSPTDSAPQILTQDGPIKITGPPPNSHPTSSVTTQAAIKVCNILLLGPTQSGKSTFLEHVRQYANPSHKIDETYIGYGNKSHTKEPRVEIIETTLPEYKLYEDGMEFKYSNIRDLKAIKKFLARDDDLELRAVEVPGSPKIQFNIYDTPGLNDTSGNDIVNIAKTFSCLANVAHLHLIIIMGSLEVPLLDSQMEAYKAYFELFQEFKGLMAMVHTHSPNQYRIPGLNMNHDKKLRDRSRSFDEIAGQEVPSKTIDFKQDQTEPAHVCMTLNTIREILEMATIKASVAIDSSTVRKTRAMIKVDKIVHDRFDTKLKVALGSCQSEYQTVILDIERTRGEIKATEDKIELNNTEELMVLDERRFDDGIGIGGWVMDFFRNNEQQSWEFKTQHTIQKISLNRRGIDVQDTEGGKDNKYWNVKFKRSSRHSGYYHAVLKTSRRVMYQKEIEAWHSKVVDLKSDLETQTARLNALEDIKNSSSDSQPGSSGTFDELRKTITSYRSIMTLLAEPTLPLNLFLELANTGNYRGSQHDQMAKVLEGYYANMFGV